MKKIVAYKFTLLTAAIILTALLLPAKTFSSVHSPPGFDKVVHAMLFFLFTFAFGREYRKERKVNPRILVELTTVLPFIVISELLQLLTRSRHFEFLDMVADAVGAAAAIAAAGLYHSVKEPGKKRG
jgi:peptidoglycan/LPS O-acetylase OafA/YrhL